MLPCIPVLLGVRDFFPLFLLFCVRVFVVYFFRRRRRSCHASFSLFGMHTGGRREGEQRHVDRKQKAFEQTIDHSLFSPTEVFMSLFWLLLPLLRARLPSFLALSHCRLFKKTGTALVFVEACLVHPLS